MRPVCRGSNSLGFGSVQDSFQGSGFGSVAFRDSNPPDLAHPCWRKVMQDLLLAEGLSPDVLDVDAARLQEFFRACTEGV